VVVGRAIVFFVAFSGFAFSFSYHTPKAPAKQQGRNVVACRRGRGRPPHDIPTERALCIKMYLCPSLLPFASSLSPFCWLAIRALERAKPGVPGILSSHMVLQRDKPIHIWGWSDPGEKVSVAFHGISREATGDSLGNWGIFSFLPSLAGGPYQSR